LYYLTVIKNFKKISPAGTKKDGGGYVGRLCWRLYRGTSRGNLSSLCISTKIGLYLHFVKIFLPLLVSLLILLSIAGTSSATTQNNRNPKPYIGEVSISKKGRCLEASFKLINPFPKKIKEALESGVPIKYSFSIELSTPRFLLDKKIAKRNIEKTLLYDAIKGEFRIISSKGTRILTVNTLKEAEKEAFSIKNFPVCTISKLSKGKTYVLKIRAVADKGNAFLPFEGLIDIFSRWGFATKWHEIKFTY